MCFMCSNVTRIDLGKVSMSSNLIRETIRTVGYVPRFISDFVLPRLFEKRFYIMRF